ncbi:MAG: trypsin-like serine protease [Polyangiales bacterium]
MSCAEVPENATSHDDETSEEDGENPVLAIQNGVPVSGAGPQQQWQGIVMTMRRVGTNQSSVCTATFITERHLLTAAHCYEKSGPQQVFVRAPGWGNGGWQAFDRANVTAASGPPDYRTDIAVVDLGAAPEWATPARRFRIFAGKPTPTDLHIYGYGGVRESTAEINGTLRTAPGGATVRISDAGNGYLVSTAAGAAVCSGDSGGPAIRQGSQPVVWGINRSFSSSIFRSLLGQPVCPTRGASMQFTNVSTQLPFVERALGKACARVQVDGQPAAQCW